MPPLPPLKDTLEALQQCVLPGAGGAALVAALFLCFGRRAGALGSAVAVVVGYAGGNFTLALLNGAPPDWTNTARLLPWVPDASAPGYQWMARAALVLVVVGLVSRGLGWAAARALAERYGWVSTVLVWLPRLAAVVVVSGWLVRGAAASAEEWATLRWELAGAMLLVWAVLDGLTRGGTGTEEAASLATTFYAASAILLYAHVGTFVELAVVIGSAMFGIAVVSAAVIRNSNGATVDVSGAVPAAVAFLPGLILGGRPSFADTVQIPAVCFWLVALAPLLLATFLVPRVGRQNRWLRLGLRALLVLAPLVVAVVLAGQHAKFSFEEADEWK